MTSLIDLNMLSNAVIGLINTVALRMLNNSAILSFDLK